MSEIPLEELLRSAFKGDEWLYLSRNKAFQAEIQKQPKTTEGFEHLVDVGCLLLRQRQDN